MSQELIREVDARLIVYFDPQTGKWHPAILPEAQRDNPNPAVQPFVRFDLDRRITGVIACVHVHNALKFCQKRAKQISGRHMRSFPGPAQPLPSAEHVAELHKLCYRRRMSNVGYGW